MVITFLSPLSVAKNMHTTLKGVKRAKKIKADETRWHIEERCEKKVRIYSQREENADSLLHEDGHVLRLLRHHVAEDALGARRLLTPPRVSVPGELRQETVLGPLAAHHAVRERNSVLVVRQLVLLTTTQVDS